MLNEFDLNLIGNNDIQLFFVYKFYIFFATLLFYVLFAVKFYRALCYTNLTLEGLPLINPYVWPSNVLRVYAKPYFQFWKESIPPIRINKRNFDASYLVGIEFFEGILFFITNLRKFLYAQAELLVDNLY